VTAVIVFEAVRRLVHPVAVHGAIVVPVAAAAIVTNAAAALVLREPGRDLNVRSIMAHMAADVASSTVVLVAGVVILTAGDRGWERLDPLASLVVAMLIVIEAARLARESADVLLESTPSDVDLLSLERAITGVTGVEEVHDLHVWSLSTEYRALSAHVLLDGHPTLEQAQEVGSRVREAVETPFAIAHTTFELECERCADEAIDPCGAYRGQGAAAPHGVPSVKARAQTATAQTTERPSLDRDRTRRSPE
jgi:cobalt-zinc-cadmium efflux system protein